LRPKKQVSKKTSFILRVCISIAILFALIKFIPYKEVVEIYKNSQKIYILWGCLIFLLSFTFVAFRWRFLLASLGIKLSLREVSFAFFSGLFFNLFFPSFIAGDVFRGFSISRRHGNLKKVTSSILMDRFSGLSGLAVIVLFAFFAGRHLLPQKQIFYSVLILCLLLVFVGLVIFSKRFFMFVTAVFRRNKFLKKRLINLHEQLYFFRNNPVVFFKAVAFSIPVQMLGAFSFFIVSKAFGVQVSAIYFFVLVPIIMVIAFIPITIAGIGTREAAAVYFFSLVGIEKSVGLSMSLLNLVFLVTSGILGGIFYVSVYHRWLQSRS
jgi:uncharacterized protein (TIRG00374 family)